MSAALALLGYAFVMGTVGAHLLRQASWPERAPRLGILTWQSMSGSVVASVVLAGLGLGLPARAITLNLAELLDTCVMLLRHQYATPGGAFVSTLGLTIAGLVLVRGAYCGARAAWTARSVQNHQRRLLAIVGRDHCALDAVVLEHAACAAYCVPGRGGRVVFTTATLAALDDEQLAAVMQHERAHLRGRHHVVILAASSLRAAFPFVPAFRWAEDEVGRLTEMLADDSAARHADRLTLATALVRLAEGATPAGALGAGGATALTRVKRLAAPAAPLGRARGLVAVVGVALLAVTPLVLSAAPIAAVMSAGYCPVVLPQ